VAWAVAGTERPWQLSVKRRCARREDKCAVSNWLRYSIYENSFGLHHGTDVGLSFTRCALHYILPLSRL
jgi:hypothetical protein